mmetsp:Transcript_8127/g.9286  ORF Transcript_8127/g.9286 Transcript_8127/m.9286 type:complete len:977 (-) Transcript_8127:30-2960(-)
MSDEEQLEVSVQVEEDSDPVEEGDAEEDEVVVQDDSEDEEDETPSDEPKDEIVNQEESESLLHKLGDGLKSIAHSVEGVVESVRDAVEDEIDDAEERPMLVRQGGGASSGKNKKARFLVLEEYKPPSQQDKLRFVKLNHPWNKDKDRPYKFGEVSFGSPVPFCCLSCCHKSVSGDFLGTGVVSYFKLLKAYARFFFLLFLATLPVQFFNYVAQEEPSFLSLTVGNLYSLENLNSTTFTFPLGYGACEDDVCTIKKKALASLYVWMDFGVVVAFILFNGYIMRFLKRKDFEANKYEPSIEQYTLEVKRLPRSITYEEIRDHFEKFGPADGSKSVYDVQIVTKTKEQLRLAIKHGRLAKSYKRKKANYQYAQKLKAENRVSDRRMEKLEKSLQHAEDRLKNFWHDEKREKIEEKANVVLKAYVTFNSREAFLDCYRSYNPGLLHRLCNLCKTNEDLDVEEKKISVQQTAAPESIKWEHQEYPLKSRIIRSGIGYLITLFIILAAAGLLTYIENLAEEVNEGIAEENCDAILATANTTNCVGINLTALPECEDFKFCNCQVNADGFSVFTTNPECAEIFALSFFSETAGTAVVVTVFNVILQSFINVSIRFEKKLDLRTEENAKLIRFFIASFINTAVIVLVKEMDIETILGISVEYFNRGEFIDFDANWYNAVGSEIVLIVVGNVVGIHVFHYLEYLGSMLRRKFKKPLSQADLNELHLGHVFYLSIRYAQFMVTVFLIMVYSPGIPCLYLFVTVTFMLTYVADKYLLFKFYRTPPRYNNATAIRAVKSLKWAAFLHLVMSIWTLTSPNIFPDSVEEGQSALIENINEDFSNSTTDEAYARFFNVRVFPLTGLALALPLLDYISRGFFKCWANVRCCCSGGKRIRATLENGLVADLREEEFKAAMNARTMESLVDTGHLVGLESYNILANPLYWNTFFLKEGIDSYDLLDDNKVHSTTDVMKFLERGDKGLTRIYHKT